MSSHELQTSETQPAQPTILIVDDDPDFTKLATLILSDYQVRAANSATEALAVIDQLAANGIPLNLVLTDIAMPDTNGYQLAKALQSNPDFNTPIAFVTALTINRCQEQAEHVGVTHILQKPLLVADLITFIDNILNPPPAE